jgi:two-component system invasion response regulator UvrY
VSIAPAASTARSVLRVLLVDDHALVRHGLAVLLEDEPDIAIVGEACDGIDALAQMEGLHPDLVLMDYSMPRMDGLEATRRIKQRWPRVRVIGLSMYREADRAAAMLDAGACAYVDKTAGADALLAAIRGEAAAAT